MGDLKPVSITSHRHKKPDDHQQETKFSNYPETQFHKKTPLCAMRTSGLSRRQNYETNAQGYCPAFVRLPHKRVCYGISAYTAK
jgi:hypothetical protein